MAIIAELDNEAWENWLSERPQVIKDIGKSHPPNKLYLLKSSGHRVTIYSYSEDGTVTVNVTGEYNLITFSRQVFGIDPEDLEECDFPEEGETLGEMMDDSQSLEWINTRRAENGLEPLESES